VLFATHARAKLNLSLHVRGRRMDGYHELESLVAFGTVADHLTLAPDQPDGLLVDGPLAAGSGETADNLVLKALGHLRALKPDLKAGHFHLTKYLPAQAGLGGGSADAAAALRLLARLNAMALDDPRVIEAARLTGADVPVCLASRAVMMRGIGDRLGPVVSLPTLHVVLLKPDLGVSTKAVFDALGLPKGMDRGLAAHPDPQRMDQSGFIRQLRDWRNDLEAPAQQIEPIIGAALQALHQQAGVQLVRMSGSGSAVFGLFENADTAFAAQKVLAQHHPQWWIKATRLR
jgi:4-diphosphocytidyl-2-C-methyl-D-erythritol kinase